jgi:predicted nucleic acid-binding protein
VGFLVDTSVFVAIERGEVAVEERFAEITLDEVAIASITASELLHGVHRAGRSTVRASREAWVEGLLQRLPVLAFDLIAARLHARLAAEVAQRGASIGAHDLLIAATALSRGLGVITRDKKSFPRIAKRAGLDVRVW